MAFTTASPIRKEAQCASSLVLRPISCQPSLWPKISRAMARLGTETPIDCSPARPSGCVSRRQAESHHGLSRGSLSRAPCKKLETHPERLVPIEQEIPVLKGGGTISVTIHVPVPSSERNPGLQPQSRFRSLRHGLPRTATWCRSGSRAIARH